MGKTYSFESLIYSSEVGKGGAYVVFLMISEKNLAQDESKSKQCLMEFHMKVVL